MDNIITVKVGPVPGRVTEYTMNGGEERTVRGALALASLSADGYEIRLNGEAADMDTAVDDGDVVLLVKKIRGN